MLVNYLDEINKQLDSLNARFSICSINPNFRGSERAEFTISLRNNEINTSDKNNSFRTSLSEGDKRTLSFAFFIAALKSNVRLSDQIVIFDDPFTSLDSNRRRKTLDKIIEISKVCNQVIILTHDEFFARDLFTKINSYNNIQKNKTNGDFVSLKTIEIHPASLDYSEFKELNILKKCRGKYYRNYDLISNFVDTPTDFQERLYEIAKSIRPLLEGYLHRKYPNSFRNGVMLGTIISEIKKGILLGDSIFSFTQDDIETMRDISEYASSFHHDTDVDSPPETIQQHELTQYCKRTLEILHG